MADDNQVNTGAGLESASAGKNRADGY